ncbi:CDGSH iron-sulfur domain-containing protein [Cellulomonas sp. APG4]|uniref:CDGSH iron-sulfur domain-containing protein n=1 Tax=Cellulomonas sp. APG4 TaxID=1538656 RepID=UPI00351BB2A3
MTIHDLAGRAAASRPTGGRTDPPTTTTRVPATGATVEVTPDGWVDLTACPDGPLLVRGDAEIRLADGSPAPRRRATVALCRCGATGIAPFCDGSHKVVGFRSDPAEDHAMSSACGGCDALCRRAGDESPGKRDASVA